MPLMQKGQISTAGGAISQLKGHSRADQDQKKDHSDKHRHCGGVSYMSNLLTCYKLKQHKI